jgi:glycosyltransferase involved in cell wall biosynthesis
MLYYHYRILPKRSDYMSCLSKVSIVIPSLDPDEKLLAVVDGLLATGFDDIILVNDGSKPENLAYFETAAANSQVTVLHHPVNLGKGAALKTAFAWFLENRAERVGVVTADGDNQHHPEDIKACAQHLCDTGNFTLGVRDFSLPHVPDLVNLLQTIPYTQRPPSMHLIWPRHRRIKSSCSTY